MLLSADCAHEHVECIRIMLTCCVPHVCHDLTLTALNTSAVQGSGLVRAAVPYAETRDGAVADCSGLRCSSATGSQLAPGSRRC